MTVRRAIPTWRFEAQRAHALAATRIFRRSLNASGVVHDEFSGEVEMEPVSRGAVVAAFAARQLRLALRERDVDLDDLRAAVTRVAEYLETAVPRLNADGR